VQFFDMKLPAEKAVLTFNMAPGLFGGNTLFGTPSVTVSVYQGTDPNPSALLNGAPGLDASSTMILIPVQGGLPTVQYLFEVECATQQNNVLLGLRAVLPVGQ
jgi:hypothetical protein